MIVTLPAQPSFHSPPKATRFCTHNRIIDDVPAPAGLKTGQVRCLECGDVFDDPALVQEGGAIQNGTSEQPWHD